jgi:hypothetical protein
MLCEEISRRKADRLAFASSQMQGLAVNETGRLKERNRRDK